MKKYNYVYKITNLVNGKIYIGKHKTDRLDDGYMGSGHRLRQAYKKYGLECFNKEVIDYYSSEEELNRGEIYWIEKLNATNPEIGYNLAFGGNGGAVNKGKTFSDEHRRKISQSLKGKLVGEKNGMYDKHYSPSAETKRKLSDAAKGENNGMYGKRHSEETKRKISEARKLYLQKRKENRLF